MPEKYEFRVAEEFADLLLKPEEGKALGYGVRKVEISPEDPRFDEIGKLQTKLVAETNRSFFHGWIIHRQYTKQELEAAALFHLRITAAFEPAGEECGTVYDDSTACPRCYAGRTQTSDLYLDLRRAPKTKDIARTIANEWIVSQRLAELMLDAGLTGFELRPVRHKARYEDDPIDLKMVPTGRDLLQKAVEADATGSPWKFNVWLNRPQQQEAWDRARSEYASMMNAKESCKRDLPIWYQLVVISKPMAVSPQTRCGIGPFDDDAKGEHRCPMGHVLGLNLLSEVHVNRAGWDGSDVCCTKEMVGTRRGLLVPTPLLLASPKLWRLIRDNKIHGCSFEVAYLL